ncbi:MAG: HNH nuclease family protein [Desulfomonile tiedjei]|uniref:Putative HNH nuclease YajD n=1 Tax=Desulfomonile tiedjei TaxID=2358 RepID=A0A9D6UZ52_9BACT|nr:HNH nuclease family protein [Desulfomonile tiedjei]
MSPRRPRTEGNKLSQIVAEARRSAERRENTYREQALRIFPHICGRCGREFTGKRLRELTVHHKDHNHENNPPDGRNWELLCTSCHDKEHARYLEEGWHWEDSPEDGQEPSSTYRPFASLEDLLKTKK